MTADWPDSLNVDPQTLRDLRRIVETEAVGQANALTASTLADRAGIDDSQGNPHTRKAVKEYLLAACHIPVRGCNSGYYVATDRQEIDDELESLEGRIQGIRKRQEMLETAWESWHAEKQAVTDGGDEPLTEAEQAFLANNPISREQLLTRRRGDDDD